MTKRPTANLAASVRDRLLRWTAFLRRTGLRSAPEQFADTAVLVRAFLLPIYEACAAGTGFHGTWSTDALAWIEGTGDARTRRRFASDGIDAGAIDVPAAQMKDWLRERRDSGG